MLMNNSLRKLKVLNLREALFQKSRNKHQMRLPDEVKVKLQKSAAFII